MTRGHRDLKDFATIGAGFLGTIGAILLDRANQVVGLTAGLLTVALLAHKVAKEYRRTKRKKTALRQGGFCPDCGAKLTMNPEL